MSDAIPADLAADDPPFSDDDLDRWLDAGPEPGPFDVDEAVANAGRFMVHDVGTAEWAMAKVAEIDATLADARDHATEYHARIDRWFADQTARAERRRAHLAGMLAEYAVQCRQAGGPATLRLVGGNVATTSAKAKVEISDADTVLEWARANQPDLVTTTEKVLVSDLRKVAAPAPVPDGWEWCALLDCGHQLIEHTYKDPAENDPPFGWAPGGTSDCPECSDALGDHVSRIDQVTPDRVTTIVAAVVDPESGEIGDPVPGALVTPATITAKVNPAR